MKIEFQNLSFRYGGKRKPEALSGVSGVVGPGIHLLLGENGAGKTTLLHLIDGLRFPTSGKCLIDGGPTGWRLPSVLSKIFYLEAGMMLPARSVEELVSVHAQFYPAFSPEMLAANLAEFNVDAKMRFSAMSAGMRQKAAVAYTLALNTPILLLDEPARGLDIASVRTLQRIMARCISPEQTVIVATHHVADLEMLYDSLMILRRGRLLLSMPTDEITGRLAFVSSPAKPDDALFSMRSLGMWRSIVACDGDLESNIDYELLYLAMQNDEIYPLILNELA